MNDQSQTSIPTPDLSHLKSADYEQVHSKLKILLIITNRLVPSIYFNIIQ